MAKTANKPKNLKVNNINLILSTLRSKEEMTVYEITEETGISKTTVNKLLLQLVDAGIVRSLGKGSSTDEGGRRPEQYCFNASFGYVISLDIYDQLYGCAILDLKCHLLFEVEKTLSQKEPFPRIVELCKVEIENGMRSLQLSEKDIASVVVSCSGIVNEDSGVLVSQTIGDWDNNLQVKNAFENIFNRDIPVIVNNVSLFSGYAELIYNPELRTQRLFTLLFWDEYVGSSIIRSGHAESGAHSLIFELGHMRMEPGRGSLSGELEKLVNDAAVLQYANENARQYKSSVLYEDIKGNTLTIEKIFAAYKEEDAFAVNIIGRSAYYIALALQYVFYIYDPDEIIIQGFYYLGGEKFLQLLQKNLKELIPYLNSEIKLSYSCFSKRYRSAYNFGACLYAVERLAQNNYGIRL